MAIAAPLYALVITAIVQLTPPVNAPVVMQVFSSQTECQAGVALLEKEGVLRPTQASCIDMELLAGRPVLSPIVFNKRAQEVQGNE